MASEAQRFVVRRRGDGWSVVDSQGGQLECKYTTEAKAEKACAEKNGLDQSGATYGVSWYVEVDAISEEEAVKKARKFLAPGYRNGNWDPLSVEKMEKMEEGGAQRS